MKKKNLGAEVSTSGSITMSTCKCSAHISSFRLLSLKSSWEDRIRERWRHRLIRASPLEPWLLTSGLNHMTPTSSSSATHSRFKGLPVGHRGHREDLRGRWELEDTSEARRLPAGLSSSPQVHYRWPCPCINVFTTKMCMNLYTHITLHNKWQKTLDLLLKLQVCFPTHIYKPVI